MVVSKHKRITTSTTTTFYSGNVALRQIGIVCSNAGTTWTFSIRDRASSPAYVFPPTTITQPSDGIMLKIFLEEPIPMENGIDVVTSGGTPGVVDVWISTVQPGG